MFPAQTSLIPATVALVRWIEASGFSDLYPYWYLGTTPVKYLIGPVVPGVLIGLHKILPGASFFDLSIHYLLFTICISSVGWGILAWKLSGRKSYCFIVSLLILLAPWHWVSGLALSELSATVAGALTPWVLLAFSRSLTAIKKRSTNLSPSAGPASSFLPASAPPHILSEIDNPYGDSKPKGEGLRAVGNPSTAVTRGVYPERQSKDHVFDWQQSFVQTALVFALLLLTNSVSAIPAIVGLVILGIVLSKRWEDGLKRAGFVIVAGWLISTLWYGPGYWLTIWGAPSLGGRTVVFALGWVIDMFRGFVPFFLAVGVVIVGIRPKDVYSKFVYSWFFVFAILTLIRFMADPDFWMDWTAWMGEVEVGVALLFAKQVLSMKYEVLSFRSKLLLITLPLLLISGWFFAWQQKDFWLPRRTIEDTVEYKIASWLRNNLTIQQSNNSPIVFLSGTTAFWLNSLVDVAQVRGGADHGSVDGQWREAAWVIRQGATADDTERALRALNISYIVVHTDKSEEFYHDFENTEIFKKVSNLEKVYDSEGDRIYKAN